MIKPCVPPLASDALTWRDFYWNTIADRTPDELRDRERHLAPLALIGKLDIDPEHGTRGRATVEFEHYLVKLRLWELGEPLADDGGDDA